MPTGGKGGQDESSKKKGSDYVLGKIKKSNIEDMVKKGQDSKR